MILDWFDPDAEASDLYYLLYPELQAAAQVGGTATLMDLARQGAPMAGFDWSLPNEAAAAWAEKYTFGFVKELTKTTQEQLQQAVSTFHATPGMTRGDLERLILQGPGGIPDLETAKRFYSAAERAEMIAVTETTRSYTEGNIAAMRALGVDSVEPKQKPPAHVRCRCDITPYPRDDGVMSWQWQTLNDDLVCEICAPLNGLDVGEGAVAPVEPALPKPRDWVAEAAQVRQKLSDVESTIAEERKVLEAERNANLEHISQLTDRYLDLPYGSAERQLISDQIDAAADKENEIRGRLWDVIQSSRQRQLKVLQVEKPVTFKVTKLVRFEPERNEAIDTGVKAFRKLVEVELPPNAEVQFAKAGRGRASYSAAKNSVNTTTGTGSATVVHELGHWLEDVLPDVHAKAVAFYEKRTKGELPETMNSVSGTKGYAKTEMTKKDKFIEPYMGKDYVTRMGQGPATRYATELVSMGLQYMYVEPLTLATQDPEMFDFIYTLVRGG